MIRAFLRWLLTSPVKPEPKVVAPEPEPHIHYGYCCGQEFDGYNEIGGMG
jgi:hypothetical protein